MELKRTGQHLDRVTAGTEKGVLFLPNNSFCNHNPIARVCARVCLCLCVCMIYIHHSQGYTCTHDEGAVREGEGKSRMVNVQPIYICPCSCPLLILQLCCNLPCLFSAWFFFRMLVWQRLVHTLFALVCASPYCWFAHALLASICASFLSMPSLVHASCAG
jgi:hypothetical protein